MQLPIAIITAFNEKSNENYENVNYVLYTKKLCKNCWKLSEKGCLKATDAMRIAYIFFFCRK